MNIDMPTREAEKLLFELSDLLRQELKNNDRKYLHTFLEIKNLVGYLSFTEKYNAMQEFVWEKSNTKYEFE